MSHPAYTGIHAPLPRMVTTGGSCGVAAVESRLRPQDNFTVGLYNDRVLKSAFQPIVSLAHRRAVGFEALVRPYAANGEPVPPLSLFREVHREVDKVFLDRLCRALHIRNAYHLLREDTWLFLNINPTVVLDGKFHGAFFSELLHRTGFPAGRIVVEILEGEIGDEGALAEAVGYYRELGCLVAIDDFGAGHSNFERIWRIEPDIVKLDRSVIKQAQHKRKVRRALPGLISLIHEVGSLAVIEGVENEEQGLICLEADVDFAQGYFFAHPSEQPGTPGEGECLPQRLCERFKILAAEQTKRQRRELDSYFASFRRCVSELSTGAPFDDVCRDNLTDDRVARCYLLDEEGFQIGSNYTPANRGTDVDIRLAPLADAAGASWFRKPYFRRAVNEPRRLHVTRPYLSITGVHMCVTLSMAFQVGDQLRVFCCDLDLADDAAL